MFAKHLPPSADLPRVLVLDEGAAVELAEAAQVVRAGTAAPDGAFDAVVGHAPPEQVAGLSRRLRPGGRLILADSAEPRVLLQALVDAGLIHCLVETGAEVHLYRGERPPQGTPVERQRAVAAGTPAAAEGALPARHVFVLVTQTPNKPAWRLAEGERVTWHAVTALHPETGQPQVLAFTSLAKAVAFMQGAILAGAIGGVNKVGKFPASVAQGWGHPLRLNPVFDPAQPLALGPGYAVEPQQAVTGEE